MDISIINIAGWVTLLQNIRQKLNAEIFAKKLAELMQKFVHVRTGFLRSSIYYYGDKAGAAAAYAGYESAKGGSHDFVTRAINALDIEEIAQERLDGLY